MSSKHKMWQEGSDLHCAAHGVIATGDQEYLNRMVVFHVKDGHAYQPTTDPLWPNGDRPMCSRCGQRPVYLAGLCGNCYAEARR